ncbi:TetR/AcrR family transcriptional regulator [Sandaracinobacter sp. RS1-74]|nr:TetR/AcrR family transcriptional regulator [Sandaracinobacteroides sayramensis]
MRVRSKSKDGYASAAMAERRRRIFETTRELMSEQGVDGFSVNEVCRRAGVARQTIYQRYGTRDDLMAAAMLDLFERSESLIPYHHPPGSLERLIERMVGIGTRNLGMRGYIAALTAFYFNPASSRELRAAMHAITSLSQRPYVEKLADSGLLQPWMTVEQLLTDLDAQRMIVVSQWVNGQLPDERMIDAMVKTLLTYLLGCVRPTAQQDISHTLLCVHEQGAAAFLRSSSV